jgi:hypothetical protein
MAAARRKTIDTANLHLSDGTAVRVTIGESTDGRDPLVRVSVEGRTPRIVGLWTGRGSSESHVEIEIANRAGTSEPRPSVFFDVIRDDRGIPVPSTGRSTGPASGGRTLAWRGQRFVPRK